MTYSEEVAFNDPPAGAAEQLILNQHLRRLLRYSGLSALQRGVQQVRGRGKGGVLGRGRAGGVEERALRRCSAACSRCASPFRGWGGMGRARRTHWQDAGRLLLLMRRRGGLARVLAHDHGVPVRLSRPLRAQVADGYFIKYFASVTALLVYALPIYLKVRKGVEQGRRPLS